MMPDYTRELYVFELIKEAFNRNLLDSADYDAYLKQMLKIETSVITADDKREDGVAK